MAGLALSAHNTVELCGSLGTLAGTPAGSFWKGAGEMLSLLSSLGISLLFTLILELVFALAWSIRTPELRSKRELTLVVLVNTLTNPVVVLLANTALAHWHWGALWLIPVLELGAILTEWLCYRACSYAIRRPFGFSLCANLFSVLTGFALNLLWLALL